MCWTKTYDSCAFKVGGGHTPLREQSSPLAPLSSQKVVADGACYRGGGWRADPKGRATPGLENTNFLAPIG